MCADERLYTLTEVAQKTKISMPTLQRYKKLYQDRIPSHGQGRSQRYPEEALDVFRELKKENIGKRGRPRKNAAPGEETKPKATKTTKSKAKSEGSGKKSTEGLLTLTQISSETGISYPTLLRYVKMNLKGIPHRGSGRGRRFLPEAIEVFKEMKGQSRRGRKPGSGSGGKASAKGSTRSTASGTGSGGVDLSGLVARIKDLEKQQKNLEKLLIKQEKLLSKPIRVTLQR